MDASIYTEVREFVEGKIAAGVIVRVDWLTSEYIGSKSRIDGDDYPFYKICAQAHVNEVVRRVVGKYDSKPKSEIDPQGRLKGFDHLQRAYTVIRAGVNVLVPIDKLTDDELLQRAAEYKEMAKGCGKHAEEIRQFVASRQISEAAE